MNIQNNFLIILIYYLEKIIELFYMQQLKVFQLFKKYFS